MPNNDRELAKIWNRRHFRAQALNLLERAADDIMDRKEADGPTPSIVLVIRQFIADNKED
jgi:hypothetical protein